jgi:hypothetical protein
VAVRNFAFVNVSPLALRIVAEGVRYNLGDPGKTWNANRLYAD